MLEVLSQVIGFALGLASGFYFERRASRSTEATNRELREQLDHLREANEHLMQDGRAQQEMLAQLRSILSAVRPASRVEESPFGTERLEEQLHCWLKSNAGPDGSVANGLARAKAHLAAAGSEHVQEAFSQLVSTGRIEITEKNVRAL